MENEILKLFEEIDLMIMVHDYDQIRVRKVKELVEKYQRITQKVAFKLLEKTLEDKTKELAKTKQELQMANSTNLILSKRIQDLELARNQVSGQKNNLKSDLEESYVEKEVLIKLKHKKIKPYKCNSCNLLCSDEHDLKAHLNSVHESNKPKICSISGVSSLKLLGSFKNRPEQVLKEVIDESKTTNSGSDSIKVSESTVLLRPKIRKSFSTNIQKPAKLVRVLSPVLSSEDGSKNQPPKKFTCQICDAHFATKTNVANHIRSVHDGKKNFLCAECDKTFSYRTSLLVHKRRVHEKIKFPCSRCESQLGCAFTLKKHIERVHEGKKSRFECSKCPKTFTTKQAFINHYKKKHN